MDRRTAKIWGNIKNIALIFEKSFLYKQNPNNRLHEVLSNARPFLRPLDAGVFTEIEKHCALQNNDAGAWGVIFLKMRCLYEIWLEQLIECCQSMNGKLLPVDVFNRGAVLALNLADLMQIPLDKKEKMVTAVENVLKKYPDCGYRFEADDGFDEKRCNWKLNLQVDLFSRLASLMTVAAENAKTGHSRRG